MIRTMVAWVVAGLLLACGVGVAIADGLKPATRMSRDLANLAAPPAPAAAAAGAHDSFSESPTPVAGDWVTIDAVAVGDPSALEAELIALGARDTAIAGRLVSARLPIAAIPSLEGVTSLQFARPAYRRTHVGNVTSQGDHVMRADAARATFGVDGSGVMVGVLSDSFNCRFFPTSAANDMASGDLPPTVTVLQDNCSSGTDEGRAMLQIVHDVAPGASLAFATAEGGQAAFANNIRALRDAGATVIVDDVIYINEPMFQDGVVAQAVDEVKASGVAYFSAAGNDARHAYEHDFVPGQFLAPGTFGPGFFGGTAHNFGGTVMQRVAGPGGSSFTLVLQWDSPFFSVSGAPGTQNDVDVYLISGGQVVASGTTDNLVSRDPVESLSIGCGAPFGSQCVGFIVIVNNAGANPGHFKYVVYSSGGNPTLSPATSSGTIYGHANANGAVAVGAAFYKTPTTIEPFSSAGTTPVFFDVAGDPINDLRQFKPEIVAPDGVDTTFFGSSDPDLTVFPNFFGTSAAAPHAAAVAALLLQAVPTLTPDDVRTTLETTAQNMGVAGFDTNTGFGLIHADSALNALHVFAITAGPTGTPNPVIPGGAVSLTVTASDSLGHTLTYAWVSTCTALSSGTFDNAASATPTWTAPANATGVSQNCALKVTVTDGHGFSKSATHTETVLSVPRITSVAPAAAPVGAAVVISGMSLTGASGVTFSGPVTVTPTAVTATTITATVPAGARTGVFGVTTPVGIGASTVIFKVLPKITGFAPASAVGGSATVIIVSGTNLRAVTGEPTAKVGTVVVPPGSIVSSTPTELQFRVPLGAVTGKISVTTVDGTALSPTNLTVIQPPRATAFAPAAAAVGTTVTITGTNMAGATDVTFTGGVTVAPTAVTATSLQAVVPAGALTGPVTVTNPIGTAASAAIFKVLPKITGFAPASAVGGSTTIIVVSGTNLRAATGQPAVKIGTFVVPPGSIVSSTPTELQFRVPLGAVTGKISLTTVDGTTLSATDLTVIQPPRATAFAPAAAAVGTTVTITGTNMAGATDVTFTGGVTVAPTAVTATSLKAVVPAGALTGPVSITNGIGTGASTVIFKVLPKITGFAPASAVGGSATVIIVSGTNLRAATGEPTVKVGTVVVPPGSIVSSTPTDVQFRVPLGAVTGKISVTTVDGTTLSATDLTVIQPPRATAFAPAAAAVGTTVTITGTNMAGATDVTFTGGVTVAPTAVTATSLKAVVPAGALTGPVSITNGIGTGASTVILKVLPKITGFAPASAVGGSATVIVVSGTNLRAATGEPTVKVGTFVVPPGSIDSSTLTELQFRVPLGAVTGKISVTTVDGAALSATDLTVVQPPRATAFAPPAAAVGTTVTITGTNMLGTTDVTFAGGVTVTPTAVTATSLKAVVPAGALTGPVSITNGIGTGTSTVIFKVLPKITGFAPASAVGGSATVIIVSGTNLRAATGEPTVKVGTVVVPPGSIVSSTPTEVQFRVPLGAVTGKISVTTVDGTTLSAADLTVIQPPRATAFAPAAAAVGTTVTITGTNMAGATDVTFTGGVTVAPTAVTATSLHAVVPAGALTGPVSITNGIGTAASAASFKVLPKITGFTPSVGALDSMVVVSGTNLKIGSTNPVVKVGTLTAAVVTSSPTEVTFTVPLLAVTGTISITTADGIALSATALTVTP